MYENFYVLESIIKLNREEFIREGLQAQLANEARRGKEKKATSAWRGSSTSKVRRLLHLVNH